MSETRLYRVAMPKRWRRSRRMAVPVMGRSFMFDLDDKAPGSFAYPIKEIEMTNGEEIRLKEFGFDVRLKTKPAASVAATTDENPQDKKE